MKFKVLTYNIHGASTAQNKYSLEAIITVLRATCAEIIGIQEVDKNWSARSNWQDQEEIITKELNMHSVFSPTLTEPPVGKSKLARRYGILLLSKFPILKKKLHLMYVNNNPAVTYNGNHLTEPRSIIQAKIGLDSRQSVWVICTHLSPGNQKERLRQTGKLKEIIQSTSGPLILMGDLNAKPHSEELSILKKHLQDPSVGKGFVTGPKDNKAQIDYILTRNLAMDDIRVIESDASDHRPLLAHIKLK